MRKELRIGGFGGQGVILAGIILGNIAQFVKGGGLFGVCVVLFLLPIIYNVIMPKKKEA